MVNERQFAARSFSVILASARLGDTGACGAASEMLVLAELTLLLAFTPPFYLANLDP